MGVVGCAWIDAVAALGGRSDDATAGELEARYREPHRHYHDLTHIEAVLTGVADLALSVALSPAQQSAVVLAACAHDVVYDAVPGADERASAEWAANALIAAGLEAGIVDRVRELVLLTVAHTCDPADVAAALLLDADLAILAADPADYQRYVAAVRAEYGNLADPTWRAGRRAVLQGLLARANLFSTAAGRDRWEGAARDNVGRELRLLTSSGTA